MIALYAGFKDGYIEVEKSFIGIMSDKIYWYANKANFLKLLPRKTAIN
jgi:hypothetical protein